MQRMRTMGIAITQRKSSDIVILLGQVEIRATSYVVGVSLEAPGMLDQCDMGRPLWLCLMAPSIYIKLLR